MTRIIALNGPARSGKDTIANAMCHIKPGRFVTHKLAQPLRDYINRIEPRARNDSWFEENKDSFMLDARNKGPMSIRQTMIDFYQTRAVSIGEGWLVRMLLTKLADCEDSPEAERTIVITDCGRNAELELLRQRLLSHNVRAFRIHRAGKTFESDARKYVTDAFADVINLENQPTLAALKILEHCDDWLTD